MRKTIVRLLFHLLCLLSASTSWLMAGLYWHSIYEENKDVLPLLTIVAARVHHRDTLFNVGILAGLLTWFVVSCWWLADAVPDIRLRFRCTCDKCRPQPPEAKRDGEFYCTTCNAHYSAVLSSLNQIPLCPYCIARIRRLTPKQPVEADL